MASTTFSLFFPLHTAAQWPTAADALDDDHSSVTTSPSSPSSSSTGSVDCTLSLGTPSSRRAELPNKRADAHQAPYPPATNVPRDVAAAAAAADQSYYSCSRSKPAAATAKSAGVARADHDQMMLVDRRCANCGTSSTPLWRNGPRGPKSLCNACGIRFKKEERRAAAAAAMDQAGCGYLAQRYVPPAPAPCCEGAFPCGGGDVADPAAEAPPPLLAWRLNVVAPAPAPAAFAVWPPERSSLFQYN